VLHTYNNAAIIPIIYSRHNLDRTRLAGRFNDFGKSTKKRETFYIGHNGHYVSLSQYLNDRSKYCKSYHSVQLERFEPGQKMQRNAPNSRNSRKNDAITILNRFYSAILDH